MKNKSTSKAAFFNLRVLIGVVLVCVGAFVALIASGTFSKASAQERRFGATSLIDEDLGTAQFVVTNSTGGAGPANVSIDGMLYGTSLADGTYYAALTPGSHSYRVSGTGFSSSSGNFSITNGQTTNVPVYLQVTPVVQIAASPMGIQQGGISTLTISTTNGPVASTITVNYFPNGKAISPTDYTITGTLGQMTITSGQSSATQTITATSEGTDTTEGSKFTLKPGAGYTITTVTSGQRAQIQIQRHP